LPVSLGSLKSDVWQKLIHESYDDDRWPSGSAGGKVIEKFPEHKGKHILFTPHRYGSIDLGAYVHVILKLKQHLTVLQPPSAFLCPSMSERKWAPFGEVRYPIR
jgi:hypothetical protein